MPIQRVTDPYCSLSASGVPDHAPSQPLAYKLGERSSQAGGHHRRHAAASFERRAQGHKRGVRMSRACRVLNVRPAPTSINQDFRCPIAALIAGPAEASRLGPVRGSRAVPSKRRGGSSFHE
jgi:hypothetical protein